MAIQKIVLRVKGLEVSFAVQGAKLRAVRGIDFEVGVGEAVGIVGESGCGKSAAVQALLKLGAGGRVAGQAWFEGEDLIAKTPEELRRVRGRKIGMVFQDPMTSLNPTMKAGAQIAEGIVYHSLARGREAKRVALEWLRRVGVPDPELRFGQYPHELSGGLRQRVAIAVALACDPALLIADEPTTALDVTVQAQILRLLKELQRRYRKSLLLITHDLGVVAEVCEKVLVMYAGKIVERGTVEEVLGSPRHPYTQMLLRAIPRLDRPKEEILQPIEGAPPNPLFPVKGCAFRPRCPYAGPLCVEEPPNGKAACWRER